MTILLTLISGSIAKADHWADQVGPALTRCRSYPAPEALRKALDIVRRADDWAAGRELADIAARFTAEDAALVGPAARAYWRAGDFDQASAMLKSLHPQSKDATALAMAAEDAMARGDRATAVEWANRLTETKPERAHDWLIAAATQATMGQLQESGASLRRAAQFAKVENGYPDNFVLERLDGMPEFIEKIGVKPVNTVGKFGEAPLDLLYGALPMCEATINGKGPFRLIVDTGGSLDLSLDTDAAETAGVKGLVSAKVRGVSGLSDSMQAIADELILEEIKIQRVLTRVYRLPEMLRPVADGIIGAGIFNDVRLQFDFADRRLVASASSDKEAPGRRVDSRIVADAKLIIRVKAQEASTWALLDTGADIAAIAPSMAARLFPNEPLRPMAAEGMGVGEGSEVGLMLAPSFDLEIAGWRREKYSGLALRAMDDLLSPALGVQTSMLIGMPILRQAKTLTIDYPRCAIWIDWND